MLLFFLDSLLLIFITTNLGFICKKGFENLFACSIQTDALGIFLTGLLFSAIYFNILSFWLPVDQLTLVPLVATSLFFLIRNKEGYRHSWLSLFRPQRTYRSTPFLVAALLLIALLFYYWSLPSSSIDAPYYYYESIRWYEQYKVVPGLANVHGRFAFNPAAFIIQSAYSFTGLTGQSIYPLNTITTGAFLFWLLARMFKHRNALTGLVYLLLFVILGRYLLIYISSPSSDLLSIVCIAYALIRVFEHALSKTLTLDQAFIPLLIILFAPLAKLSAYPVLLALPFILYLLPEMRKKRLLILTLILLSGLIYLPWIGRNYIMSGYLVYPFPWLDLFHPDWKAPKDILMVNYDYIKYDDIARIYSLQDIAHMASQSFFQWFPPWVLAHVRTKTVTNLCILVAAILSPLLWIITFKKPQKPGAAPIGLYLIVYAGIWIWLNSCPEYRFGTVFLALAIALPLMFLAQDKRGFSSGVQVVLLYSLFLAATLNYFYKARIVQDRFAERQHYGFSWKTCWLYPLKDYYATIHNNKTDFPYTVLNSGVKLYLSDSTHACLNADLPCMSWKYGQIEMRGRRIDEGFRNIKNEVWKNFPFQ